jgi:glycosyltransferase involved in cell wall biosynthesis
MKILLVSRRYWPEVIGGGQISAHHIAQALVKAAYDVHVLTFNTDGKRVDETIDGVRITRLPIRKLKLFPRFSNLEWMYREMKLQTLEFIKEFRPDVMHAMNSESIPSIAAVSRATGIPFVAGVNSPTPFCFVQQGNDSRGKNCFGCRGMQRFRETMLHWGTGGLLAKLKAFTFWLYSYPHMFMWNRSVRQAKILLPISEDLRQRLLQMRYPDARIRVVHNPINVHAKVKTDLKKRLGIPAASKVLLFAGRITEDKGVQQMIRVLPSFPTAHLVVAGKGEHVHALQMLAAELNVHERVHFVGFIANDQLGEYYSIANLVAMPGTFYESLGRMLMEACTYGVPVIGTHIGGIPDVIEDGKNGYLLQTLALEEFRQKVGRIFGSPTLAKRMGVAGIAKMKAEFSPAAVAKALTDAYLTVTA